MKEDVDGYYQIDYHYTLKLTIVILFAEPSTQGEQATPEEVCGRGIPEVDLHGQRQ